MENNDQKRIFIGIPSGDPIKSILPKIKSTFAYKSSDMTWLPLKNIHLTLSFLGDISNNKIPALFQSLENNILSAQFQIRISRTGVFPSEKTPKILWLGLDKGKDELKILNQKIEKLIMKYKIDYDKKPFIPHITVARIKKAFGKIDVLPFLNSVYSPIELEVNSISIFESKLFPKGVQYTVIKTFPLN